MKSSSGPHVSFACICEKVLLEQDGVLSAIRIVDKLNLHQSPREKLDAKTQAQAIAGITILVGLKSGDYKGSGKLSLKAYLPSGQKMSNVKMETEIEFKGGMQGANTIINVGIPFSEEGVYWIDILFEGKVLTRVPLSVSVFPDLSATPEPPTSKLGRQRSKRKA